MRALAIAISLAPTARGSQKCKKPCLRSFPWWAHKGSNLGPLPCEGNALPLSYAPGNFVRDAMATRASVETARFKI